MNKSSYFPKGRMIPVNGVELEVFEAGQENRGKPIVLCHGWPELAYSWRYQVPALVDAGYHVIVPNQRGYGNSSRPTEVSDYDIKQLAGDLTALLDHYHYDDAVFAGHDWGAMVVWWLTLLHPERVKAVIALSVPYQVRTEKPWIEWMEELFGRDYYFVHFNRQPGVADAILDQNASQFLQNMFRKNLPALEPQPGMAMINLAKAELPLGEPVMGQEDLRVFTSSFESTGFTSSINWYRNLDRNWHILAEVNPIIEKPVLMIYGDRDVIPQSPILKDFVPHVEVVNLDCGHWIQQEKPEVTSRAMIEWLKKKKLY